MVTTMTRSVAARRSSPRPGPPATGGRGWATLRVWGVPVRVDASWFVLAGLVTWVFFSRFGAILAGEGAATVVAASVAAALLFFASLLAHELGHALTSLTRGIPVSGITLFLLGGVTESRSEATRARDEFVIVGIGPFVSLVLAAVYGLLYTAVAPAQPFAAIAGYLAWANLLLAIFNTLPGYPLDGGRLLRSVLWAVSGRPHASTRWAARIGQLFAAGLVVLGIWGFAQTGGAGFRGLWEVLIGIFLFRGAAASHARARARERLARRTVRDVMGTSPPPLDPSLSVAAAAERMQERPSLLWPVGDPLVGAVTLGWLDGVPRDAWPTTLLGSVALPAEQAAVEAAASLDAALDRLSSVPGTMLIVVDGGRPTGLLTASLVAQIVD
jgi:Zn-dependent protease/CBS domain-containing protein